MLTLTKQTRPRETYLRTSSHIDLFTISCCRQGQQEDLPFPPCYVLHLVYHQRQKKRRTSHKQTKIYNKDIICLPHVPGDDVVIPIPRGEKRSKLAAMGLIGKIAIHSVWQSSQVQAEVSSVFSSVFGLSQGDILSYEYLRYMNSFD